MQLALPSWDSLSNSDKIRFLLAYLSTLGIYDAASKEVKYNGYSAKIVLDNNQAFLDWMYEYEPAVAAVKGTDLLLGRKRITLYPEALKNPPRPLVYVILHELKHTRGPFWHSFFPNSTKQKDEDDAHDFADSAYEALFGKSYYAGQDSF